MKKMSKKKKYLAAMVALSLMAGGVSEATDRQFVDDNGKHIFEIVYFDAKDKGGFMYDNVWQKRSSDKDWKSLSYDFTADMKSWFKDSCNRWIEILKPGLSNIKNPTQIIVGNGNEINAFATTWNGHGSTYTVATFKNAMQGRATLDYIDFTDEDELRWVWNNTSDSAFARVIIGQGIGIDQEDGNYGFMGMGKGQIPQQAGTASTAILFHEMGHALGILADVDVDTKKPKALEDDWPGQTQDIVFSAFADDPLDYTSHLLDENGNKARAGQVIIALDAKDTSGNCIYTPAQQEAMKAIIKAHPEKYFQLSQLERYELDPDLRTGRAFFVGDNVKDALGGKQFWGIDGLPINGWENGTLELSHIELERSLMSHQSYRSYNTFMEAELALMQDIGYTIDRKNFYGRSIYNNDLTVENSQGFFARNEDGTDYMIGQPNTATLGVGLHIYGSRNNITQTSNGANDGSADLLACGTGGAGIRIDGVENTVTLAKDANIEANGDSGVGILAAYGRDHTITVEGNVSALGENGDAVRFDFGTNNDPTEYRGSYIRYSLYTNGIYSGKQFVTSPEDMQIKASINRSLTGSLNDGSFSDTQNGDLGSKMGTLNVSGTLAGKSHAIYIANNAFVDNINIEKGAKIYGDIASDWKHFDDELYGQKIGSDSKLVIQYGEAYGEKEHYYDEYCKDFVTNLNINGDFAYAGNITGSDNMKLKVNEGATMAYTGNADVVSVQVTEGASLFGGNYKVNEIKKYAKHETIDNEAGKLINHGTIGALDGDSDMNIDGNLESNGTLLGQAGGDKGRILVSGKADLQEGSKASGNRGIHGETVSVLQTAGGITGAENVQGGQRGLLNYEAVFSEDRKSISVNAQAKESLAGANSQQAEDYESIKKNSLAQAKNPGAEKELRSFYALEGDAKALEAIDEIGTNDKKDSTTAILSSQTSSLVGRVLSSRLAKTMGQAPAMLRVGTDHADADVLTRQAPDLDHSVWAKFSRNWGDTASGSNYTGNTYTIGCDWQHGDNQRNGWFASYTKNRYGHSDGNEKLQDTRVGYYTGMNRGANTMLLYADFGYLDGSRSRMVHMNSLNTSNLVKGDYTGWLVELGGEWKHDLHEPGTTTWQVSPYGAVQMSYLKQHGYSETGSLNAYDVSGGNNFYSALEGGVECSRDMPKGGLNFRLGLRQALTGTDYDVWETSSLLGRGYSKSGRVDKTHFVTSLAVETGLAPNWQLGAEAAYQKGAHDRDFMANLQLRWLW